MEKFQRKLAGFDREEWFQDDEQDKILEFQRHRPFRVVWQPESLAVSSDTRGRIGSMRVNKIAATN